MNRILCLLSVIIFSFELHAQCPDGHVFLNSQEEIDSFPIKYPDCTQITGSVEIISADITSIRGLDKIKTITGKLVILSNPNLIEITGFNSLETIHKNLEIRHSKNLTKISGFKSLKSAHIIEFDDNNVLNELNLFEQLDSVLTLRIKTPTPLQVKLNHSLTVDQLVLNGDVDFNLNNHDLYGLRNAYITESSVYSNFNALSEFIPNTVKGLTILRTNHFDFKGISNFINLETLSIEDIDTLNISEEPLTDSHLSFYLRRVSGELDFNKLSGLKFFRIGFSEINELENLDFINDMSWLWSVRISSCPSLKSVSQLENARNLQILDLSDNTSLSECNASRICDLIEINSPGVSISGNLSSCENIDSVATQCIKTSSQELTIDNSPLFFPNPCTEFINLNAAERSSISVLNIYNMNGARMKSIRDLTPRIDLSELPEGPYLFQSVHNDRIRSEIIILR